MEAIYKPGIKIDAGESSKYPNKMWGFRPSSQVNTESDFISMVRRDLGIIQSAPIGRDLIELIGKRHQGIGAKLNSNGTGRTVTITNGFGTLTEGESNTSANSSGRGKFSSMKTVSGGYQMRMSGGGANVKVLYNPKQNYTSLLKLRTPSYIALAHELIHAWHWMSGNFDSSTGLSVDFLTGMYLCTLKEEAYTVGLGPYANTRISENTIRQEHGLPLRKYYRVQGDCDRDFNDILTSTRPRTI